MVSRPAPLLTVIANPAVLSVLLDGGLAALGQIVMGAGDLVLPLVGFLCLQLEELGAFDRVRITMVSGDKT